ATSPSCTSVAIGWLTFTPSAPSSTRSFPIRPSSTASNSMVALSVSISARISPEWTSSPSLTSHFASLPSSMVGDRAGMRISIDISGEHVRVELCRIGFWALRGVLGGHIDDLSDFLVDGLELVLTCHSARYESLAEMLYG